MSTQEYQERLKLVIEHLNKCSAVYQRTEHVRADYEGETIWEGDVEVFSINSILTKAKHCYRWSYGEPEEFITILEPMDAKLRPIRNLKSECAEAIERTKQNIEDIERIGKRLQENLERLTQLRAWSV